MVFWYNFSTGPLLYMEAFKVLGTQVPQFYMDAFKVLGTRVPQFYVDAFKVLDTQVPHFYMEAFNRRQPAKGRYTENERA
jgi:putative lipoic acid-binding regulatory protein